jgi:hypothetical protein
MTASIAEQILGDCGMTRAKVLWVIGGVVREQRPARRILRAHGFRGAAHVRATLARIVRHKATERMVERITGGASWPI